MEYIIRKATIKDTKCLNNLLTLLIHDEKKYDENINEKCVVKSLYENMIKNDKNCLLIAEVNKKIIGYLFGFIKDNGDAYINIVSQLEAMFVIPSYRKSGIGNSLIQEFKCWSKEQGAKYIELNVCNENIAAISLYKKNGFKDIKTVMYLKMEE